MFIWKPSAGAYHYIRTAGKVARYKAAKKEETEEQIAAEGAVIYELMPFNNPIAIASCTSV